MKVKRNIIMAGAIAAFGLAGAPALAQDHVTHVQTARELALVCNPRVTGVPRLESIAYCQGFLTSFGQYHALTHPAGRARPLFCMSNPGPTVAESGLAFASWTDANPQHAGEPALDGLLRWAEAAHPCPAEPARRRAPRAAR